MVKLKSLTLNNFRSFVGEHRVVWPDNGLVLLKGESGVGKSTIFHAINYALGVNTIPVKDLQNWSDQGPTSVKLEVQVNDDLVDLFRSSKASYVRVNGQTVSTSNKAYEDALAKVLGVGSAFRELLTYRDQINPVKFTRLADADKKSLLSDLLGLNVLEEALATASKDAKILEAEWEKAFAIYQGMHSLVGNEPQRTAGLEDRIEALKAEREAVRLLEIEEQNEWRVIDTEYYNKINQGIRDLEDQIKEVVVEKSEVDEEIDDTELRRLLKEQATIQAEWDKEFRDLSSKSLEVRQASQKAEVIFSKCQELSREYDTIDVGKCPTCQQVWDANNLKAKKKDEYTRLWKEWQDLGAFIAYHGSVVEALDQHQKERPWLALEPSIEAARKEVATTQARNQLAIQNAQSKVSVLRAKIKDLESNRKLHMNTKRVSNYEHRKTQIQADLTRLQTKAKEEATEWQRWSDQHQRCQVQSAITEEINKKFKVEEDWVNFLKGFLGRIFEEVLVEIAAKANEMLRELPNTASVTVEFQIQKASGKESITPIYSFGGQIASLKSGASGGMATAIELAIDLAMAQTVAARKGLSLKWLLLDEAFNGFSQTVRESFLTVLQSYAKDSLVIVVDHAGEFQAHFQQVLTVDEKGLTWLE